MKENRWNQFDGLRYIASLIIVASHTGALGLTGQGGLMVVLFFVLSGYFFSKPMLLNGEEKYGQLTGWLDFILQNY